MAEEYLVAKGCPPPLKEDISEDCASNHVYTTRLALSLGMERLIGITTPAREQRALYFGHLVVSPHCQFDVVTIDHQGTPAEIAQHEQTLKIQQYAFMDIKPGDLNALEARFYDGEPYGYFKYLDLAKAYSEKLAAQLT